MNPAQAKRFGRYIQKGRIRAGLSQAKLAKIVGVDNTRVLRLERGDTLSPNADFLSRIAEVLGLDVFEVYEKAGYVEPSDLPSLSVYLRSKYGELPATATDAITAYAEKLAKRHGVNLSGPESGEDELPEREPLPTTKVKGGVRHAAGRPKRQ